MATAANTSSTADKTTGNSTNLAERKSDSLNKSTHKTGRKPKEKKELRRYGYYRCIPCNRQWSSAQTYVESDGETETPTSKQACMKCKKMYLPYKTEPLRRGVSSTGESRPHRADLCERCLQGRDCRDATAVYDEWGDIDDLLGEPEGHIVPYYDPSYERDLEEFYQHGDKFFGNHDSDWEDDWLAEAIEYEANLSDSEKANLGELYM